MVIPGRVTSSSRGWRVRRYILVITGSVFLALGLRTFWLEPGQTVSFQFRAPATEGQYPYVCTFPSHWQVMNGILNVVAPAGGRGGRGGRGGA